MLRTVIYTSSATGAVSEDDLRDILAVSRRNNSRLGLSGVLLYREGTFLQVLEGPKDAVEQRMRVIAKDPRHTGLDLLSDLETEERFFPDWAMGSRNLDDEGAFHLSEDEMKARLREDVPPVVRVLVRTFFRITSRYAA
ncbi:BLUF domain-containing protein [Parvularcula oceani]|uniref:BLUF domain-containing protein n=1 Tax=Parvularcula oceani TaxID=1247963 RepID=UPI00068B49E0|nr:BLUF domain-containing protein [Parvularcula oceani]